MKPRNRRSKRGTVKSVDAQAVMRGDEMSDKARQEAIAQCLKAVQNAKDEVLVVQDEFEVCKKKLDEAHRALHEAFDKLVTAVQGELSKNEHFFSTGAD